MAGDKSELKTAPPVASQAPAADNPEPLGPWTDYVSKDGGYSVKFPSLKINEHKQTVNAPGVGAIAINMAGVELASHGGIYTATFNDYPPAVQNKPDVVLDGARQGMIASMPGGKVASESVVTLSGFPGRAFAVEVRGQGRATLSHLFGQESALSVDGGRAAG